MKTSNLLIILFLCLQSACNATNKPNVHKVTFGIYETVKVDELPGSFIQTLKNTTIKFEKNTQAPIIGYIEKNDAFFSHIDLSKENFKIVKTVYPVDKEGKYFALVAVKRNPAIDNSDIDNTKGKGTNVEIYFNMKGARKWAELTRNNIGKLVAFTIDDQIYTLPKVNGEIRSGEALINRLNNEATAKSLSESLNSSISN